MAEAPRKLAAIVSVDIAGFSALAERDAAKALAHVARVRASATGIAAQHIPWARQTYNVDAWRAGALETTRPHISYETALLFIGETVQLRMNPEFPPLCTRLGLSRYWHETELWPDCAMYAPYDFKTACGT